MEEVNRVGSFMSNFKKYCFYALKISPLYIVFSVLIIWGYLGYFSRLDLLMGSVNNNATLASIFFSFVFVSILISILIMLPSINLISLSYFVHESYITSAKRMPSITLLTAMSMLGFVFIFSSDSFSNFLTRHSDIKNIASYIGEPIRSLFLSFIVSVVITCIPLKIKNSHANIHSGLIKVWKVIFSIFIISFICFASSLSIIMSISIIMLNIDGYTFSAFIYAFLFLSFYSLLSLFPAMVFYSSNFSKNNKNWFDVKFLKEFIFSVMASLFFIILIWPNGFLFIGSSVFSVMGVLDKKTHYYNITSSKYYKELFPKSIWDTRSLSGRNDFFIKAVNMFSLNGVNLICPVYVENLRKNTLVSSFDEFPPKQDKHLVKYFKAMTRGCVVLGSDEFKQWDTIIGASGDFKEK
ncbi:Uncharacterised protein [Yersinia intermedia]|nr:Uncharacterised protein [Yersinia intermedia]